MGAYHGKLSLIFFHKKAIVRGTWLDLPLRYRHTKIN
jgi:hypothetical protein